MQKKTILIINEGVSQNIGDQAIQMALDDLLKDKYKIAHAFLSSHNTGKAQAEQRNQNKIIKSYPLTPKMRSHIRWILFGDMGKAKSYFEDQIKSSDAIIIGGGQLIKNNISLFCERLNLISEICTKHNKPYGTLGVGVDEYLGIVSRARAKKFLRNSNFVCVRDHRSRERLQAILSDDVCVEYSPDLAFSLPRRKAHFPDRNGIGLNILPFDLFKRSCPRYRRMSHHDYIRFWARAACIAAEDFAKVTLFTTGSSSDISDTKVVCESAQKMRGVSMDVAHPQTLSDLGNIFDSLSHAIVSRMHAGIIGYTRGTSTICLNWDDKILGCWESAGQKERVFSPSLIEEKDGPEKVYRTLLHDVPGVTNDDFSLQIAAATERCLKSFCL
jgi:polysaccharide pyruvyl transferase WcaK-like protein